MEYVILTTGEPFYSTAVEQVSLISSILFWLIYDSMVLPYETNRVRKPLLKTAETGWSDFIGTDGS
jgi:hypothetical protein